MLHDFAVHEMQKNEIELHTNFFLFFQRAEGVLRRMKEAGITPEICSYNAAVAAWGR